LKTRSIVAWLLGAAILASCAGQSAGSVPKAAAGAARHIVHPHAVGSLVQYTVPTNGFEPAFIAKGPDDDMYVTPWKSNALVYKMDHNGNFSAIATPIAMSDRNGIDPAQDGNMWYTDYNGNAIGKINVLTGVAQSPQYPTGLPNGYLPLDIVSGPDGNLWATVYSGAPASGTNYIIKISPSGNVTPYQIPNGCAAIGIVAGPDGALWFTQYDCSGGKGYLGRITTSGAFSTPYAAPTAYLNLLTVGPDNNIWLTAGKFGAVPTLQKPNGSSTNGSILKFTVATGTFTSYVPATGYYAGAFSGPNGIVSGPDGNLWYTELDNNQLIQMDTSGNMLSTVATDVGPYDLAVECGHIFVTEFVSNEIGILPVN
jgi:streptogramin lyase